MAVKVTVAGVAMREGPRAISGARSVEIAGLG
jgi:hypothetical protein